MALPKTNSPIKPRKIKKLLFAKAWCRGATARWKIGFFEKKSFEENVKDVLL